jgi:Ca2+/H+ antiporter
VTGNAPVPGFSWWLRKTWEHGIFSSLVLNWLLIFVPVAIELEFFRPEAHTYIFIAACLSIVPLAGWLGHATEHIAHHAGEGIGGRSLGLA